MARSVQHELNWGSPEDRDVREILAAFEAKDRANATSQMAAIGRAGQDRVFMSDGRNSVGFLNSQVHAASFHYWGQRLGYKCWDDPAFMREYLRDNPYARVQSRPRNPTFRVGINFRGANFNGMKPIDN